MPLTFRINQNLLDQCMNIAPVDWSPNEATQAVRSFGPLAAWWLPSFILEMATEDPLVEDRFRIHCQRIAQTPPSIPTQLGSALILLAGGPENQPEARLGFVLPVQWVAQTDREHRLPQGLLDVAQSVHDVLISKGVLLPQTRGRMKLQLPDALASIDLSQFSSATWDSAWLPLAGALVALHSGSVSETGVWATGQYGSGLRPVNDIRLKLEAAKRWGVTKLFFPKDSTDVPENAEHDELVPLFAKSSQATLIEVLNPYLNALAPLNQGLRDRTLSEDELASRFLRFYKQRFDESDQFFKTWCLPRMEERLRQSLQTQLNPWPTTLITVASNTISAACLTIAVLQPKRCIILHTEAQSFVKKAEEIMTFCQHQFPDCDIHQINVKDISTFASRSREAVTLLTPGAAIGEVTYDLTPGTKEMTLALMLEVAQPGTPLLYCRHQTTSDNWPITFTQDYRVIAAPDVNRSEQAPPVAVNSA